VGGVHPGDEPAPTEAGDQHARGKSLRDVNNMRLIEVKISV
jgi:hypothetical protein